MNVSTTVDRYEPVLMNPRDVPEGKVYSWGEKVISYLRVRNGSICLTNLQFLNTMHEHFSQAGPRVQVADKADLTITYKG